MKDLFHYIYANRACPGLVPKDIEEILVSSRENNTQLNITGMLLLNNESFFQVLEGPFEAVTALVETIRKDNRHEQIVDIIQETISQRAFGQWSMGFAQISSPELNKIPGFNDFFAEKNCLESINAGRAKKLLHAYSRGYWQNSIL